MLRSYATIQDNTKIVKKRNVCEKNIATFTTRLNNENWDFIFLSECEEEEEEKNVMHSRAIALNNKATFENYNRAKTC